MGNGRSRRETFDAMGAALLVDSQAPASTNPASSAQSYLRLLNQLLQDGPLYALLSLFTFRLYSRSLLSFVSKSYWIRFFP